MQNTRCSNKCLYYFYTTHPEKSVEWMNLYFMFVDLAFLLTRKGRKVWEVETTIITNDMNGLFGGSQNVETDSVCISRCYP